MSEDIKPCAHCGSTALLQEHPAHSHADGIASFMPDYPGSATITCCNDDCNSGMIASTVDEVTAAWNRRAVLSASASDKKDAPEYVHGEWFKAQTIDEMQAFYLSRLPAIRAAARELGYAIGLHGSTRRDFDLIAMPWRDGAADKDALAHAIAEAACGISRDGDYQWERKPLGRVATSMPICWTAWHDMISAGHIDLSVMDAAIAANAGKDKEASL